MPTTPAGALDDAHGVAVSGDGAHLYATASSNGGHAVSHFRIDAAGNLIFAGCIGDRSGCTATTPAGALDGAQGVAESADGANLYVTSSLANTVSHFIIAGFTAR